MVSRATPTRLDSRSLLRVNVAAVVVLIYLSWRAQIGASSAVVVLAAAAANKSTNRFND